MYPFLELLEGNMERSCNMLETTLLGCTHIEEEYLLWSFQLSSHFGGGILPNRSGPDKLGHIDDQNQANNDQQHNLRAHGFFSRSTGNPEFFHSRIPPSIFIALNSFFSSNAAPFLLRRPDLQ